MIILDTNVVSEVMKSSADAAVMRWMDEQEPAQLCLTAVNLAELLLGIALVPEGRRKRGLVVAMDRILMRTSDQVLAFDEAAARTYALILSRSRERGIPIAAADGQIAAIAAVHGYAVATRDVAPFLAAGVAVVNPWED